MKLTLHRAEEFNADFDRQYRWYLDQAGEAVAGNFLNAVAVTLPLLANQPEIGTPAKIPQPPIAGSAFGPGQTPVPKNPHFLPGDGQCAGSLAPDAWCEKFVTPIG